MTTSLFRALIHAAVLMPFLVQVHAAPIAAAPILGGIPLAPLLPFVCHFGEKRCLITGNHSPTYGQDLNKIEVCVVDQKTLIHSWDLRDCINPHGEKGCVSLFSFHYCYVTLINIATSPHLVCITTTYRDDYREADCGDAPPPAPLRVRKTRKPLSRTIRR